MTGLSLAVLPSSGARFNSVSKALFNYTDWTLLWTILFVYSIQVSAFSVFFGQLFKRRKKSRGGEEVHHLLIVFVCSTVGKTHWILRVGDNDDRLLFQCTSWPSVLPVSFPQCWTSLLHTSSFAV